MPFSCANIVRVALFIPSTNANTTIITVVATVTAAKSSLPNKFPTHKLLITCMDACSKLANRMGSEKEASCLGTEPVIKPCFTTRLSCLIHGQDVLYDRQNHQASH